METTTKTLTETQIAAIVEATGGTRWTKNNIDRIYLDLGAARRLINAHEEGEADLSKTGRRQAASAKFWIDARTGEAHADKLHGSTAVTGLRGHFAEAVEALIERI